METMYSHKDSMRMHKDPMRAHIFAKSALRGSLTKLFRCRGPKGRKILPMSIRYGVGLVSHRTDFAQFLHFRCDFGLISVRSGLVFVRNQWLAVCGPSGQPPVFGSQPPVFGSPAACIWFPRNQIQAVGARRFFDTFAQPPVFGSQPPVFGSPAACIWFPAACIWFLGNQIQAAGHARSGHSPSVKIQLGPYP